MTVFPLVKERIHCRNECLPKAHTRHAGTSDKLGKTTGTRNSPLFFTHGHFIRGALLNGIDLNTLNLQSKPTLFKIIAIGFAQFAEVIHAGMKLLP